MVFSRNTEVFRREHKFIYSYNSIRCCNKSSERFETVPVFVQDKNRKNKNKGDLRGAGICGLHGGGSSCFPDARHPQRFVWNS